MVRFKELRLEEILGMSENWGNDEAEKEMPESESRWDLCLGLRGVIVEEVDGVL